MKKILCLAVIIFLVSCTPPGRLSKSGEAEKELVIEFLDKMVHSANNEVLMDFMAPSYLEEHQLDKNSYQVNVYYPVGFHLENYIGDLITAKIWGKDRSWVHRLTFKIIKENKILYLYPGSHSDKYIQPWFRVEPYLVE